MKIISFEGIEGVGKSTQINLLKVYLESKNYLIEIYREPGSTPVGEKIRDILLDLNINAKILKTKKNKPIKKNMAQARSNRFDLSLIHI